jgi:hypothetical protein
MRVPPALRLIGKKPPEIGKEMRPANGWNFVPKNPGGGRSVGITDDTGEVFDALGIEMNFDVGMCGEAFELLDDAALGTMATI